MRKKIGVIVLAFMMVLAVLPASPAGAAEKKTVYADTVEELMEAIVSDTEIILSAKDYIFDYDTIGYSQLHIYGVENLSIRGVEGSKLVSNSYEDTVISMIRCADIEISNVYIGHDKTPSGGCSVGVVLISMSEDVSFANCDIYGCGITGFEINSSSVTFTGSTIRDCSWDIGSQHNSVVEFIGCAFRNNGYANSEGGLDNDYKTTAVGSWSYSEDDSIVCYISFDGCEFTNNNNAYFINGDEDSNAGNGYNTKYAKVENCTFSGNAWQTGGPGAGEGSGGGATGELAGWAEEEVQYALENGLVLGSMIGNWDSAATREIAAEAILLLIETAYGMSAEMIAENKGFNLTDTFADSDNRAVTFLKAAGISNGTDGVNFSPNGNFTRAQMVTMLGRTAEEVFDIDLSSYPPGSSVFTDVPDWADPFVGWAAAVGITNGVSDDRFDSDGVLQNQHTAVFSYRMYSKVLVVQTSDK